MRNETGDKKTTPPCNTVTVALSVHARDALAELGRYFDGSEDRAVEVAINRLHAQLCPRKEGDLADVDYGQSLPAEADGQVVSVRSLPGCDGRKGG